ncbi:MAG TPA: hypothetical protein VF846_04335 [Thermoanaerobaculia bacterium]|jgi:hypothetical protein
MEVGAAELNCGTSRENDARIAALHARTQERARLSANAVVRTTAVNGAMYLQANQAVTPDYRPFDLEGQSLVFTPREGNRYSVSREALRYVEPVNEALALPDFTSVDLGFTFSAFGRSVNKVYVSRFVGITFDLPRREETLGFSTLETLLQPQPLIAPLMQTTKSLKGAVSVHVDRTPSSLLVTWRSTTHQWFGFDVQAELRQDGSIVFSYKSFRNMRWGTPVVTAGGGNALQRRSLGAANAAAGNTFATDAVLRPMVDLTRIEVSRVAESEVFSVKLTLGGAIDASKLAAEQSLRYRIVIGNEAAAVVTVSKDDVRVLPFDGAQAVPNGISARIDGNTIEVFGLQSVLGDASVHNVTASSFVWPASRSADNASVRVTFDAVPRQLATDLSTVTADAELSLPIVEPFLLPMLDPFAVWEQVQAAHGLREDLVDGVAIYQSFFTDLIHFATAYATGGNPQVDGILPPEPERGFAYPRTPNLMHMNQVNFDENADERMASVLMLHEFGHRWLYNVQIAEGGSNSTVLNPQSFHPAAYVDTRSAFPLYGTEESSVMGGGYFTQIGENRYRARAQQYGYSWTDLYLMGLAAPEEVVPWFYLAGTEPALPQSYFPTDRIEVTGTKKEVSLQQIVDAQGPRNPTSARSARVFRVLFVLVTDPGKEPTAEEIAKMDWLRAKMERDFAVATGGRGKLLTTMTPVAKRRAVR